MDLVKEKNKQLLEDLDKCEVDIHDLNKSNKELTGRLDFLQQRDPEALELVHQKNAELIKDLDECKMYNNVLRDYVKHFTSKWLATRDTSSTPVLPDQYLNPNNFNNGYYQVHNTYSSLP